MNRDREHLRLLSIFHYIYGGLSALVLCFQLGMFSMVTQNLAVQESMRGGAAPEIDSFRGLIMSVMTAVVILGLTLAVCSILAGLFLSRQKYRTFCFVVAGVNCLSVPLGTILGVFTIIVLARESVRRLFEERGRAGAEPV